MMFQKTLSDLQLVALLREGDERAFAEIYDRYKYALFVHAVKMLGDEDEAQDVVQDLFTVLWTRGSQLEINVSLGAYLYKAIRNRILDVIARNKKKSDYVSSLGQFLEEGQFITDDHLREKELVAIIEREVARLPPKMRHVFELSRTGNLSHREIAEKLSISDKTVKKQISNAIKVLRLKISWILLVIIHPFY